MIELAGVSKIYESRKSAKFIVFGGVNFNFPSKGMFFITGKSGCGKTTLLNILGGLDKPSDGDIVVNGKKYSAFSEKEKNEYRTNTVGFVFQDYNLIGNMTVKDNLKTAAEMQGKDIGEEEIVSALSEMGVSDYVFHYPYELSGGQQQRVAIARALLRKPNIILADEPTGNLDSVTAEEIFTILKKLSEDRLVIVVSHDYANAEKFADCILRLADGYLMTERQLEKSIEDNSSFKTKQKCGLKIKHRLLFALKNLKRKPLILTIAVILCAAAIVFGVFSQALYEFKIYEKVPVSMEKNGIDLCTVKYSEKGYSDYDAEDFSYFDGETLNAMKKLNADNELYSFANIGSRFFLIKGKRDIETLGFQLADYSEELTDDGVYITDTLAQERFLNNYYKLNKNGNGECITELKDLIGTIYPSKDFSDDNSVKIDGIIISGYADKNPEDALSNTIGDKKYNFYREKLEDNYFCTEKYFRQEGLNAIKIDKTFFIADKTVNGDVSFIQDNGDRLAFIIDGAGKVYLSDAFGTETFPELKADECVLPLSVYNELFGTEYLANDFYDVFNEESAPKKIPVTGQKLTIIINSGEREISRNVKVVGVSFIPTMDILNYQSYETLVSGDFISEITSKLDIKRSGVMIKINDYKQFADYMKTIDTGNHESAGYYVTAPYADELYNYEFSGLSYVRDIFFAMAIALTVIALFVFVFYLLNIINNDKKTLGILRSLGASRGSVTGIYIWQGIIISAIIAVISLAAAIPFIIYQNHSIAKQILEGATVLNLTFSLIAEVILLPFVVMAVAVVGAVSKILKSQPIDIIKIVK